MARFSVGADSFPLSLLLHRSTGSFEEFYDPVSQDTDFLYLTFPNYENTPSEIPERRNVSNVSRHIPLPLCAPKIGIRSWNDLAIAALMHVPKAAVDENDLAASRKNQIGSTGQILVVQNISVTETMSCPANHHFRFRVLAGYGCHVGTSLFCCQDVSHKVFR